MLCLRSLSMRQSPSKPFNALFRSSETFRAPLSFYTSMMFDKEQHTLSLTEVSFKNKTKLEQVDFKLDKEEAQSKVHFLLKGVLTEQESKQLIARTEKLGYHSLRGLYSPSYRSNTRVIITAPEAAQVIFERCKPFLPATVEHRRDTWKLHGLNEQFRFCKYVPGQHFSPHMDACYERNNNERSFFTFMMYLNGGFEGGCTNFLKSARARGESVVSYAVEPATGLAVIFDHAILHEGEVLKSGEKYIMRSDVMYRREVAEEDDKSDEFAAKQQRRKEAVDKRKAKHAGAAAAEAEADADPAPRLTAPLVAPFASSKPGDRKHVASKSSANANADKADSKGGPGGGSSNSGNAVPTTASASLDTDVELSDAEWQARDPDAMSRFANASSWLNADASAVTNADKQAAASNSSSASAASDGSAKEPSGIASASASASASSAGACAKMDEDSDAPAACY